MAFKMRTNKPEAGNKYYITKANGGYSDAIKGSPTDKDCDVLSNCVGYAYGRFNEIGGYGYCKYLRPVNAENFIQYKGTSLKTGQAPKLGACMVWQKGATLNGSDGAGHVAIVVGQYEGAVGTAALACIAPLWPFFCCLSTLFGNGGAVLFSNAKGEGNKTDSRAAFTVSFTLICVSSLIVWLVILLFDEQLLRLFGADDALLPLTLRYLKWLKWGIPLWPLGYFLGAFIRNDGAPTLVGIATVCGGVFNIFGDIFLTFTCDMGIEGAGLATVLGQVIVFRIQLIHLFSKKNTIKFAKASNFWKRGAAVASIYRNGDCRCVVQQSDHALLWRKRTGNLRCGRKSVHADSDVQLRDWQCSAAHRGGKHGCRENGSGSSDEELWRLCGAGDWSNFYGLFHAVSDADYLPVYEAIGRDTVSRSGNPAAVFHLFAIASVQYLCGILFAGNAAGQSVADGLAVSKRAVLLRISAPAAAAPRPCIYLVCDAVCGSLHNAGRVLVGKEQYPKIIWIFTYFIMGGVFLNA